MSRLALSVIVPTKNRPEPLERLVQLLLAQTVQPDELIVVDQTLGNGARRRLEELWTRFDHSGPVLSYIHDPGIPGAAVARNRGIEAARGEIWLFLDDDMEPERDFVEQLLAVYENDPSVDGVSGVVSNYQVPSRAFRIWSALFLRGPFHDERQPIYWNAERLRQSGPIPVRKFGSGLMSVRAEVARNVRFDERLRGLPPGEDLDFCARLGPAANLVMAPRARIAHRPSETGRARDYWIREYAQGKLYVYYRNWRRGVRNRFACVWFEIGCALVVSLASIRRRSLSPWSAFLLGVREAARLGAAARSSGGG